jgi:hypothetical protein
VGHLDLVDFLAVREDEFWEGSGEILLEGATRFIPGNLRWCRLSQAKCPCSTLR